MTGRARELLLEILLLSEKYSDREIDWVRREISSYPQGINIAEILGVFRSPKSSAQKKSAAPEYGNSATAELKLAFIKQLSNARSSKDYERVASIAKRFSISTSGKSHEYLVESIAEKLNSMSAEAAYRILKKYKIPFGPDESYVDLAQFLIKNNNDD